MARRTVVLSGRYAPPAGWYTVAQRGGEPGERVARAFADTALAGTASLLIGADTPQVTAGLLGAVCAGLANVDAVLGPTEDGGWWALALRDPYHAVALCDVPLSISDGAERAVAALDRRGLRVRFAPVLRGVASAADARLVAEQCRPGAFTAAVRRHVTAQPDRGRTTGSPGASRTWLPRTVMASGSPSSTR